MSWHYALAVGFFLPLVLVGLVVSLIPKRPRPNRLPPPEHDSRQDVYRDWSER